MGCPNCFRCLAYFVAASSAPCAIPSASAAIEIRPPSRIFRLPINPSPSAPSMFSSGTRQSLKITSEVSLARIPSLFSFLPGLKPGVPFSRINALMPCEFFDLSVPAILLRENHAQQPHLRQLRHDLHREMRSLVPLHNVRQNLALGKFPHAATQLLLLFGEREIHGILGRLSFTYSQTNPGLYPYFTRFCERPDRRPVAQVHPEPRTGPPFGPEAFSSISTNRRRNPSPCSVHPTTSSTARNNPPTS